MRGLGQIAWLASFARPDVGADHEHRAGAPRARRDGRERRAREGRADRRASGRAASRSCPRSRCSSRTSRATTSRSAASATSTSPASSASASARSGSRRATRRATSSTTRSPRSPSATCSASRVEDGALDVEFSPLREEELELAGRRAADQRLLQREPALDARGARSTSPSAPARRRRVAVLGEMAELGRARAGVPPRGRRGRGASSASTS